MSPSERSENVDIMRKIEEIFMKYDKREMTRVAAINEIIDFIDDVKDEAWRRGVDQGYEEGTRQ
jgi:hypothetical protein